MKKIIGLLSLAILGTIIASSIAFAEPLTKEQGDAILNELKQIRVLLQNQRPAALPQPQQPPDDKVKINAAGGYVIGKKDAPITMISYSDYQCPFCNRFDANTFPEIKKNYIDTGKLKFVVRDYPLGFHQNAMGAAEATLCAGEQNKFVEMRDKLIGNHERIAEENIKGYAKEIGLNMSKYDSCMSGDKYVSEIKSGMTYAESLGVSGTPTFFIGKSGKDQIEAKRVVGAQPYGAFDAVIKDLLN